LQAYAGAAPSGRLDLERGGLTGMRSRGAADALGTRSLNCRQILAGEIGGPFSPASTLMQALHGCLSHWCTWSACWTFFRSC